MYNALNKIDRRLYNKISFLEGIDGAYIRNSKLCGSR